MDHLARDYSAAKWDKEPRGPGSISADAVTADLRTSSGRLSFWRCANAAEDSAQVALAFGANRRELNAVQLVLIEERVLTGFGFIIEPSLGVTPVLDLQTRHVDLVVSDIDQLVQLAHVIRDIVRGPDQHVAFAPRQVATLIAEAIRAGRVPVDRLHVDLVKKLKLGPA